MEKSMMSHKPKVSIGFPVFNGEKYIEEAIDSILQQTYTGLELILSDNASTDRTREICEAYVAKDPRVRYYRNEKNLGAAKNFNRVAELASGEYFKWHAHDDVIAPTYIAKCVDVLDKNPSVVLCYSKVKIINKNGEILEDYPWKVRADSEKPHERFRNVLVGHRCYEVFGLVRAKPLKETSYLGSYGDADGVLLARLSLFGQFYEIPEYLFSSRKHEQQSMSLFGVYNNRMPDYHQYTVWFDHTKKGKLLFPHWRLTREHFKTVAQARLSFFSRFCCCLAVMGWLFRPSRIRALFSDLLRGTQWLAKERA